MIGLLQGTLYKRDGKDLIILTSGVGYRVEGVLSLSACNEGDVITAYIYTHVREDAIKLFGFSSHEELKLFELLISVSGIGPKGAMNIISGIGAESVYEAIMHEDAKAFRGVSGIGAKNAEKIIIELKGKLGKTDTTLSGTKSAYSSRMELENALISLGYTQQEVRDVVGKVSMSDNVSEMVREGLKLLNK